MASSKRQSKGPDIAAFQAALRDEGIDGWLLYDFRRSNAIAHRVLKLAPDAFFSRRWLYYVPATGEPTAITSAVEAHVLASLPGAHVSYRSWQEYRALLGQTLAGARRVAMEYVPDNAIPYCSLVDAGTVELVRGLGPEVVSSANFVQRFEATLTQAQFNSHWRAEKALLSALDGVYAWMRPRALADAATSEYDIQREFGRLMRAEGLDLPSDDEILVSVNANAGNPHYSPSATHSAPVQRGDLLLLDFSARLPGADSVFADYTRMAYLGERVPQPINDLFAIIAQARDVGIEMLRDHFERGAAQGEQLLGYQVDDAVRAVIAQAGYGDAFVHRTGHNIGVMIHGSGAHLDNLETHDTRPLLPNTCTSVEPGIYLPDQGLGLRTEVDVLLLPGFIEVTGGPKQYEVLPLLA